MEYLFDCTPKLNKSDEDNKKVEVVEVEITKWIELLVNSIDMSAHDAVQYFKELKSEKAFGKKYNRIATASVSELCLQQIVECIYIYICPCVYTNYAFFLFVLSSYEIFDE